MPFARIRKTLAELGALDCCLYYVDRLLAGASGGRARLFRYYLVAQPIHKAAACRPSAKSPVALLDPADPLVALFPRPPEVIQKRLADGARCYLARAGGHFAGFLWLARDAYDEDEVRCRYELADARGCVWDYDVHVEPQYRIGRTFARLWDAANADLAAQGVRWSVSRISAFNPGSLSAHGRLGIKTLFSASFMCLGPLQLSLLGAAPYLHLSLAAASRPRLRIEVPD